MDAGRWIPSAVICLAVVSLCVPVYAQESRLAPVVVEADAPAGLSQRPLSHLEGRWLDQPVSATVIGAEQIKGSASARLVDALRFDASVDSNYTPIGYYEGFQIRGFPIDPILGIRVNGVPVVGESPMSLDNKQGVELLRGPAGAAMGTSGGLINLLTKRPDNVRELGLRWSERASLGSTLDLGVRTESGGWRLNASADRFRPYAKGADGDGQMVSLSLDRALTAGGRLELDFEVQRKSQITQPGSQLLGGTALPPINPETVLGLQSWSKPVVFESLFAMARYKGELESGWRFTTTGSVHQVKTDDRSSFPYGCSTAAGVALTYFCSNGNYDLGDFRSLNETRRTSSLDTVFQRSATLGGSRHDLSLGTGLIHRITQMPRYSYESAGTTGNVFSGIGSGTETVSYSNVFDQEVAQFFLRAADAIALNAQDRLELSTRWVRHEEGFRSEFPYYTSVSWNKSATYRSLSSLSYQHKNSETFSQWVSYRQDLEAGVRAPLSASNNGSVLAPRLLESVEWGAKRVGATGLQASATLFYSWRPYNFRNDTSLSTSAGSYVQRGTESRTGLELGAAGPLSRRTESQFSVTFMDSNTSGTGNSLFEGKQALNTPRVRASSFLAYRIPSYEQFQATAGWIFTGRRPAARDNSVYVPSYNRVDLGLQYQEKTRWGMSSYRLTLENAFDARYWRDAAEFLGDAYLTPGAPRLLRASATIAF